MFWGCKYCCWSLLLGRLVCSVPDFYWVSSGGPECGVGILCRNYGLFKNVRFVAGCGCSPLPWLALSLWGGCTLLVAGCVCSGCGGA